MTDKTLHIAVIGLGSNATDSKRRVEEAAAWCAAYFKNTQASSIYSTKPYGSKACLVGADYSNAVVIAQTELPKDLVISTLKNFEETHGRNDDSRISGIVPIDLDLVIYDNDVLRPKEIDREYFSIGYGELLSEMD